MAVISGDGVFSHVFLGAVDTAVSAKFYDAALAALGIKNLGPFGHGWILYGCCHINFGLLSSSRC